jgi:purine-binding chemotaxis protein CheW
MSETGPAVNWQEAYSRLEQTRRTLETGGSLPPEEVKRILRERAQALAKPLAEARSPAELLDLLVFSFAGERYAIETAYVMEVIPLRELTPVPCTPPFILGVVNHRGRILPVLDLRRLFELAGHGIANGGRVVAVEVGGMAFGIFADAVAGSVRLGADEVAPPPLTLAGDRQAFIRGVTGGMVAVLDLEALASDARIAVNEEVG